MERLTNREGNTGSIMEKELVEQALTKLSKFEDLYEDLEEKQQKISEELEILRNEGKTKSVKFKELMGKKLMNTHVLTLFKSYGIK